MFDPFDNKKLETLKQYPEFKDIPMIHKSGGNLYTYISLSYDINSDLIKEFPIRAQQRYEAAKMSGFKIAANGFDKTVEECFLCTDYDFDKAVIKFVSLFGSHEWTAYQIYQLQLENIHYGIRKGDASKQISENTEKVLKALEDIRNKLFFTDNTRELRKAFYDFMAKSVSVMPTPENIVDMMEQYPDTLEFQKEVLGEYMGEGYNPTKDPKYLKFKSHKYGKD